MFVLTNHWSEDDDKEIDNALYACPDIAAILGMVQRKALSEAMFRDLIRKEQSQWDIDLTIRNRIFGFINTIKGGDSAHEDFTLSL